MTSETMVLLLRPTGQWYWRGAYVTDDGPRINSRPFRGQFKTVVQTHLQPYDDAARGSLQKIVRPQPHLQTTSVRSHKATGALCCCVGTPRCHSQACPVGSRVSQPCGGKTRKTNVVNSRHTVHSTKHNKTHNNPPPRLPHHTSERGAIPKILPSQK